MSRVNVLCTMHINAQWCTMPPFKEDLQSPKSGLHHVLPNSGILAGDLSRNFSRKSCLNCSPACSITSRVAASPFASAIWQCAINLQQHAKSSKSACVADFTDAIQICFRTFRGNPEVFKYSAKGSESSVDLPVEKGNNLANSSPSVEFSTIFRLRIHPILIYHIYWRHRIIVSGNGKLIFTSSWSSLGSFMQKSSPKFLRVGSFKGKWGDPWESTLMMYTTTYLVAYMSI